MILLFTKARHYFGVTLFVIALPIAFGGCKAKPSFSPNAGGKPSAGNGKPGAMNGNTSSQNIGGSSSDTSTDEPISYPLLTFKGRGQMTYSGKDYGVNQDISAQMDKTTLTINTQSFSSSNSDVNKEVKKKVGVDTYMRVTKEKLEEVAKDAKFINETFIVFSMEVRKKDGKTVTFSSPVPAFIIPAPKTRYEGLEKSSLTYTSTAKVDGSDVPVNFTIQKGSSSNSSSDTYAVEVSMEIPSDQDGRYYQAIPIPQRAVYTVDTKQKLVTSLQTSSPFFNDDKNKKENLNFDYGLCNTQSNGETQSFPCS